MLHKNCMSDMLGIVVASFRTSNCVGDGTYSTKSVLVHPLFANICKVVLAHNSTCY